VIATDEKKQVRVFFALWPDLQARSAIATWQAPLNKIVGGRVLPAENLHTTLVFLGAVAVERMENLLLAAQEVSGQKFQLVYTLARYWGHNQIVYAAPEVVPPQLTHLVQVLEHTLHYHHFNFERRAYKPHVTLLRHAQWSDTPLPPMESVKWKVQDFVLVQSHGEGHGMRYEILAHFPLVE
jgi:2'-5' RNA ligase